MAPRFLETSFRRDYLQTRFFTRNLRFCLLPIYVRAICVPSITFISFLTSLFVSYVMARRTKCLGFILHIALFIFFSYMLEQKPIKVIKLIERFVADMKHLLLWTKFPGLEHEGQDTFVNKNCQNINCFLTTNRTLLGDLRYFDAIIFNVEDLNDNTWDLPSVRSEIQKYIFAANDSADNYPVCSSIYDNFFNWTWTYRVDSSIPFKFITVYNLNKEKLSYHLKWMDINDMKPLDKFSKSHFGTKSRAAAIIMDKCESNSRREEFVKRLQKELEQYNLTVDIFGNCGTMKCGRKSMKPFYYRLKTTYYFYLAFEDSVAVDFITDAVLYGYKYNAVSVVYGGAQYDRYLPPNSYLDAKQLGESKLAKIMNEIIKDKEKYFDLFRWKNHYVVKEASGMDVCAVCDIMNNQAWLAVKATFVQFRKWWNPGFQARCESGKKYLFL